MFNYCDIECGEAIKTESPTPTSPSCSRSYLCSCHSSCPGSSSTTSPAVTAPRPSSSTSHSSVGTIAVRRNSRKRSLEASSVGKSPDVTKVVTVCSCQVPGVTSTTGNAGSSGGGGCGSSHGGVNKDATAASPFTRGGGEGLLGASCRARRSYRSFMLGGQKTELAGRLFRRRLKTAPSANRAQVSVEEDELSPLSPSQSHLRHHNPPYLSGEKRPEEDCTPLRKQQIDTAGREILRQMKLEDLKQLEIVLDDGCGGPCILVPKDGIPMQGGGRVSPEHLCLRLYRCSDLPRNAQLRSVPSCSAGAGSACFNPFHTLVLCTPMPSIRTGETTYQWSYLYVL